ncbi:MAG: T9SS type A sorting domain-containing protein [Ignavibacteriae bacterium]|nr:T9SS type A sorting domain-containing protein [Ignavibacteriota bacterium]
MGIKTDYHFVSETLCHPKITWVNNTEPDVINQTTGKIKYKLYRAIKYYMDQIPGPPVLIENNLEFYPNGTPTYIDYQIIGCHSILSSGEPWLYPVRYWVKVVDNSNDESVFSDFTSAIGINDGSIPIGSGGDNFVLNRNIPKTFDLKQNYPNPFNPITNIKYDLPKDIFVTVKIYDLLGREIKTLVNEFKNAGSYLVSFNGSELASGIYFYRIQVVDPTGRAGNFVQVKRMVLIK